jgi:hypothetical protein
MHNTTVGVAGKENSVVWEVISPLGEFTWMHLLDNEKAHANESGNHVPYPPCILDLKVVSIKLRTEHTVLPELTYYFKDAVKQRIHLKDGWIHV